VHGLGPSGEGGVATALAGGGVARGKPPSELLIGHGGALLIPEILIRDDLRGQQNAAVTR
jgi:hypothetical protein